VDWGPEIAYTNEIRGHDSSSYPASKQLRSGSSRRHTISRVFVVAATLILCTGFGMFLATRPCLEWADRRPIGALFLASNFHVSAVNPRGWFNNPELDVRGKEGAARFRGAMLEYADQSITILKRTGAQGMIVWDLEGEQYPHKTTYIGDPRLLGRLAPEAEGVVDEFFGQFLRAGLAVGLTVRPQQLSFGAGGEPKQEDVGDYEQLLLEKIDYARRRWGATLFYIDSNGGPLWPAEVFRLRRIARQRPQILLIPEHHDAFYYGHSAPYASMAKGALPTSHIIQWLYPQAFQVLAIADSNANEADLTVARERGDILLFPAWFDNPASRLIENLPARYEAPARTTSIPGRTNSN
jgi:hypothetical protein